MTEVIHKYRLTILVGACALFIALILWGALVAQERKQIQLAVKSEAEFVKNRITADMESRILSLVRMAKRWEIRGQPGQGEWESDTALIVSRYQGFQAIAWADPTLRVRRIAPPEGNEANLGRDLRAEPQLRAALEGARDRGGVTLQRSADPLRGDPLLLIYVPIFPQGTFSGFIVGVFRVGEWLDATLDNVASGYTLAVFDGQTEIYARPRGQESRNAKWTGTTEVHSHDLAWRVQLWPRPELLARARSPLTRFALIDGLVMAALLTLAMLLAQMERERARETAAAYLELRYEIAERQQAEQALRRSEVNYRSLVENAPDGIYRLNPEGDRFLTVNPALAEMLGYASEAELLAANPVTDVFRNPTEAAWVLERCRRQKQFERAEVEWKRKDGSPITVRLSGRPVGDEYGTPESFEFIAEDVTERRALEARLQQAQKMEAIGRLAGGVAHDFNNLLMVIRGYAHMLTEILPRSDPLRRNPEEILHAADRAAALTKQLLAFSGKQVLQPQVLDLNALVADVGKLLPPLLGERIELFLSLDPSLAAVKADRTQLEQALMNMAVNARDAMPESGQLTVETSNLELDAETARRHNGLRPGRYVRLEVRDTGHGMDADTRARIFEPFFTTKPGRGTGLGLASVYGIVEQSGGTIEVASEPGQGTAFQIYLPRAEEAVVPAAAPAAPTGSLQGTETVLLVEDEEGVRRLTREFLLLRGYTVLEARNGAEAIELAARHSGPIHLLISDVVMPGMNGREVAERLTATRPEMKVLYMSAYTEDAIITYGILDPGTAFLEKPFTPDDLARQARRLLDAGRRAHAV